MSKVPKLRFPEFEGEWEEKELGEVSDIIAGQSPNGESYNENGKGIPFYQGKTEFGYKFLMPPKKWTIAPIKLAEEGDILMSVRAPVGALNVSIQKICIGRGLATIKPINNDKWFLYYFLTSIEDKIVGNGGSIFDSITKNQIEKIKLILPSTEEQQKIADCLSSLDELIEARREKIASLKAYKKGLLQQLFPEKVSKSTPPPLIFSKLPKLRFAGFEGEWEEVRLGEIGVFLSSLTGKTKEDFDKGNAKYIPYMNVYKNTFIDIHSLGKVNIREEEKQNVVKKGDILFTISSETPEEAGMSSVLADEIKDCYVNSFCSLFRFNSLSDKDIYFYGYLLRHHTIREYFRKTAQGSTRFNLSKESFKNLSLLVSKLGEQQKIADCLLSLDEKIAAETEQVAQLQQHKKGLLQQLLV